MAGGAGGWLLQGVPPGCGGGWWELAIKSRLRFPWQRKQLKRVGLWLLNSVPRNPESTEVVPHSWQVGEEGREAMRGQQNR